MARSQAELPGLTVPEDVVAISARCLVRTGDRHRVVLVAGVPIAQYAVGDRMAEAHAMVSLVDQGWAQQGEVAAAFGIEARTLRRHQRRFEDGGLVALGRGAGCPKGTLRVAQARVRLVSRLEADGCANREIARRVGVSEKAVRKLLGRLAWRPPRADQVPLPFALGPAGADPNLSAPAAPPVEQAALAPPPPADPTMSAPRCDEVPTSPMSTRPIAASIGCSRTSGCSTTPRCCSATALACPAPASCSRSRRCSRAGCSTKRAPSTDRSARPSTGCARRWSRWS